MATRRRKTDDEFMTPSADTKPGPADLASALRALREDQDFIKSLTERAKAGRLTPAESRAVFEMLKAEERPKPEPENWQAAFAVMEEPEQLIMADAMRRAIEFKRTGVRLEPRYDLDAIARVMGNA